MDSIAYLFSLETLGIKLGLENIRHLSAALGTPHAAYPSIHIAGTNGKGSVAAMTAAALTAGGRRTGRYTSPHLTRLEERFAVDGRPVERTTLSQVAAVVRDAADRLVKEGALPAPPTFFEATTAVAFEIFKRAAVDVAVLEVGLGGRFDATNIVTPIAAAITSIDLDHTDLLGDTLIAIAREKAGIVKPSIPVVVGARAREAKETIASICEERGARFVGAFDGVELGVRLTAGAATIDLETPADRYPGVRLALRGRHQAENAVVAVRLLEALEQQRLRVPRAAIVEGLERAVWPGRLELIDADAIGRPGRRVLLDAAHNPAGARALAAYLAETYAGKTAFVFGAMRDKDVAGMLEALAPRAARFWMTRARTRRAAEPATLADIARRAAPHVPVETRDAAADALRDALDAADGEPVCVAGSIYLVGELRASLVPHA